MKKLLGLLKTFGFAATLLLLALGGFSALGARTVSAQQISPETTYPFSGVVFTGTNEVTMEVDPNYLLQWNAEGNLIHTEPISPATHTFAIVIADGQHNITGTTDCTMYVDTDKTGGDVWSNPEQLVELTGSTTFTITAENDLDAWAAVKCVRPVVVEEPEEEFFLWLPNIRALRPRE